MQSIIGERERPNWCVGVSAVTMQHHENERVDRLHEGVISLHKGLHEHATTGWAGKEALLQWLDPVHAVRDAKYLSHVTHI